MNTVMETVKPQFAMWKAHFKAMANGNTTKKGNVTIVKPTPKSDVGVKLVTPADPVIKQIVTPAQQVVQMAEVKKKLAMKTKRKQGAKPTSRTRRKRTFEKTKKTKGPGLIQGQNLRENQKKQKTQRLFRL